MNATQISLSLTIYLFLDTYMDVAETEVCMEENDSMDGGERINSMMIREPPLQTETFAGRPLERTMAFTFLFPFFLLTTHSTMLSLTNLSPLETFRKRPKFWWSW